MLPATSIRQRFPGVLVDHRQTFELLSIRAGIEHEVVSPDAVGLGCSLYLTALIGDSTTRAFAGHLQVHLVTQSPDAADTSGDVRHEEERCGYAGNRIESITQPVAASYRAMADCARPDVKRSPRPSVKHSAAHRPGAGIHRA